MLTLGYLGYFAVVKPYKMPKTNKWMMFDEVFVMLISYTLMFLSQYDDDYEIRDLVGWGYCAIISINLGINACKIFNSLFLESLPQ